MNFIEFLTPAKINIYLKIQNKREDGFHNLELDLIPVSLYDKIRITLSPESALNINCDTLISGKEDNLVIKAVRLLEREVQKEFYLNIDLVKKIPLGAGLGGGSGNAAGTLTGLNQWLDLGITKHRLQELAATLGSDVPFFLEPKPTLASGTGIETDSQLKIPQLNLLILDPKIHISTAEAYNNCLISGEKKPDFIYTLEDLANHQPEWNDFWPWASRQYPLLKTGRELLMDQAAIAAGLSGSGSALFGIFENSSDCNKACQNLKSNPEWGVYPCQTLNHHPYLL